MCRGVNWLIFTEVVLEQRVRSIFTGASIGQYLLRPFWGQSSVNIYRCIVGVRGKYLPRRLLVNIYWGLSGDRVILVVFYWDLVHIRFGQHLPVHCWLYGKYLPGCLLVNIYRCIIGAGSFW